MSTHHTDSSSAPATERVAQHRRYLMCRPEHFTVSYTINPWMEPAKPTDTAKAVRRPSPRRRSFRSEPGRCSAYI